MPSVDPPSITTCSMLGYVCAATEASVSSSVLAEFKTGVMTLTRGNEVTNLVAPKTSEPIRDSAEVAGRP